MSTFAPFRRCTAYALAGISLMMGGAQAARASDAAEPEGAETKPAAAEVVARGKYLVNTTGCHDCHTPFKLGPKGPEPDMSRMLSGHPQALVMPPAPVLPEGPWQMISAGTNTAHAGAWGVSFTANLTPDPQTGLGRWSLRNFKDTIRSGRHLGRGRDVLPPMPWPVYRNLTDQDLEAVYSYLQTIPPIRNKVPLPRAPAVAEAKR